MITFEQGHNRFNYRVAGIALLDDQVLLQQAAGEAFWTAPGGRAEFGEPAASTLQREMREELGLAVEVGRLLWLVENFFAYDGKHYHEIALYFLMQLPAASPYLRQAGPYQGREPDTALRYQWFAINSEVLTALPLLPAFLSSSLRNLPAAAQHIVQHGK